MHRDKRLRFIFGMAKARHMPSYQTWSGTIYKSVNRDRRWFSVFPLHLQPVHFLMP